PRHFPSDIRVRWGPFLSFGGRHNPAIFRAMSVAVRRSPGVSGRRRHLQVPSTPLNSPLIEDSKRLSGRDCDLDRPAQVSRGIKRADRHRTELLGYPNIVLTEIRQAETDRFVAAADNPVCRSLRFPEPDGE